MSGDIAGAHGCEDDLAGLIGGEGWEEEEEEPICRRDGQAYYIDKADFNSVGLRIITGLHERFAARCREVWMGRNRNAFDMGRYVVKVPKNLNGFADNDWEGSVSNANDDPEEVRYARTRLAYVEDVPIVFMEKVVPVTSPEIIARLGFEPDWTNSVDCGQVGFARDGRLVAFDYGVY